MLWRCGGVGGFEECSLEGGFCVWDVGFGLRGWFGVGIVIGGGDEVGGGEVEGKREAEEPFVVSIEAACGLVLVVRPAMFVV